MDYADLSGALTSKGKADPDRSGDHIIFYIEVKGRMYRATKISHNARGQIDVNTLGLIARQMRLTSHELRDFVGCTLKRRDWLRLWLRRPPLRRAVQ